MNASRTDLAQIHTFPQLVKYLRDELDWPISSDNFEELLFDYSPEELGIDSRNAAKIQEIKRLRPLSVNQPWGVFFVKFEPKRLPVVALKRILNSVALKKRASANHSERAAWDAEDLLFISNYGEGDARQITFAHFSQDPAKQDLPVLKVLGWDNLDTPLHMASVAETLSEHLVWPADQTDVENWRITWRAAFTLRHREVITTSQALAIRLAELARSIRDRISTALSIETETGPLTQLLKAFQEALVHGLDADKFADMYAQTIAYGLLSARIAEPKGGRAADLAAHMPATNPFLKELMETFLHVGGRRNNKMSRSGLDFDELGINEIVRLLDEANIEAVVLDFGDRNPQEDPVIHFYELFLTEYDKKQKVDRGVFYTPRPVVANIVRSVDELLRQEFGLEDGLADTTTWGEMGRRRKDLAIPEGVSPGEDFIQILDPATGTGTFLVEAIDLIYKTLTVKWSAEGRNQETSRMLWNAYVPKHLLPRLHGYELLMAPYAIAHLKVALKLQETEYDFASNERTRIYLTDALEPPQEPSGQFAFAIPALAQEAKAVNEVKRGCRFTVLIGNPPYLGDAGRGGPWIASLMRGVDTQSGTQTQNYFESDGGPLNERTTKWINDDYIKFMRLAEWSVESSSVGVVGMVTNHSYLDNPTFRGVRGSLLSTFSHVRIFDLHGNSNKKERSPDGSVDENVFDIQQGVSIVLMARVGGSPATTKTQHAELWGRREVKYAALVADMTSQPKTQLDPRSPSYLFIPESRDLRNEYDLGSSVAEIFVTGGAGMTTARDHVVIDFDGAPLLSRAQFFRDSPESDAEVCADLGIPQKKGWDISRARKDIQKESDLAQFIKPVLYRPLDVRLLFYHDSLVWRTARAVMRHMMAGPNLGLVTTRQTKDTWGATVTRHAIGHKACAAYDINSIFPLYLYEDPTRPSLGDGIASWPVESSGRRPNLSQRFISDLENRLNYKFAPGGSADSDTFGPEDVFRYIYAVVHVRSYRERYGEFLKSGFAQVPLPGSRGLFDSLSALGGRLVALHLLEFEAPQDSPEYSGPRDPLVGRAQWFDGTVWLDGPHARGAKKVNEPRRPEGPCFRPVSEEVWNHHVGGYQVCDKWLKDRRGRTLSEADISSYRKIVVALSETMRLATDLDAVVAEHGGWPGAFTG